jgi:hypothetical protein
VYLSILALIKNEGPYLAEWIEYHLLVGVGKFYLVLNNNEDNSTEILRPYISARLVNLRSWVGKRAQKRIYNYYIPRLYNKTCWVALIDADEFLVPLETHSVPEILRRFHNVPGVTVNWVIFGTNGQQKRVPGLVLERFRNHTLLNFTRNRLTKTIVNPRLIAFCAIHEHAYLNRAASRNVLGKPNLHYMTHREAVHAVLRINHYYTKSVEEFVAKLIRHLFINYSAKVIQNLLAEANQAIASTMDVVTNDTAIDWAIPQIKATLINRGLS